MDRLRKIIWLELFWKVSSSQRIGNDREGKLDAGDRLGEWILSLAFLC